MTKRQNIVSRRWIILSGISGTAFASGVAVFTFTGDNRSSLLTSDASVPPPSAETIPLNINGVIVAAGITNELSIAITRPLPGFTKMQTNGAVLCIDLSIAKTNIDISKIYLTVSDQGHDGSGNIVQHTRIIGIQDILRGPAGTGDFVEGGPNRLLLVLSDPVYNQNSLWRTSIVQIQFQEGWILGRATEIVSGSAVTRLDTLNYLPFPVRPVTPPFFRLAADSLFPFEVTGMNDWGRNGGMFARVEAWATINGVRGAVASSSEMVASLDTPVNDTPSGLSAPVYRMMVSGAGLGSGAGEIQYRAFPHIGPPWSSESEGEAFPTLSAPTGVPFCNDVSNSWAPIYGIVSLTGIGLVGTDTRGMALSVETAMACGLVYKDIAAVATASRLINATGLPVLTASGPLQRAVPHDDIAGGCAVLPNVPGSVVGANFGAYTIRTPFSSPVMFPPGAVCFEIRSATGRPSEAVRLRGIDTNGVGMSGASKAVASRLLLRGIWIDGTNTVSGQNVAIDGTAAAGASTRPLSANGYAYLISVDCTITENPSAGSAAPARWRAGFMWDVRVKTEGNTGAQACGIVSAHAGFVSSIGCRYAALITGRHFPLSGMFGVQLVNLGVADRAVSVYPAPKHRLMLNVRIDYDKSFFTAPILLGNNRPSTGGLGLGNVFCRAAVDSVSPLVVIAAGIVEVDNFILRYCGSDMTIPSRPNNGRALLCYQDVGYARINKIGTISHSAFRSYNCKGDNYPNMVASSNFSSTWLPGREYFSGAIVHNTAGPPTASSFYYQSIKNTPEKPGDLPANISDETVWMKLGFIFNKPDGEQPLRQGNMRFRYHIGCHGNVASITYNSAVTTGYTSGFGIAWNRDGRVAANYDRFYRDRLANDYRPNGTGFSMLDTPLLNRVAIGQACLPFDLAGTPRLNDGTGAAGAYERV